MRSLMLPLILCLAAPMALAGEIETADAFDPGDAPVVILGEIHDNPDHHAAQAAVVARLQPAALVFEMLDAAQAAAANAARAAGKGDAPGLAAATGWADSGWPDFALYYPIFAAAPEARIYGMAVARDDLRAAIDEGAASVYGAGAAEVGLGPLPADQQAAREELQRIAHCDALPPEMLPGMVEAQRLRDARFAATALQALEETGGPVAVITGNGHARRDWGMPAYMTLAAPELHIAVLGQLEEGGEQDETAAGEDTPPFDQWRVAPPAERDDPLATLTGG